MRRDCQPVEYYRLPYDKVVDLSGNLEYVSGSYLGNKHSD